MKSKCLTVLVRQKFIHVLKYMGICYAYYIHIYTYTKRISLTLEEVMKKNKKKKRNEGTGKEKLKEMGALNIK